MNNERPEKTIISEDWLMEKSHVKKWDHNDGNIPPGPKLGDNYKACITFSMDARLSNNAPLPDGWDVESELQKSFVRDLRRQMYGKILEEIRSIRMDLARMDVSWSDRKNYSETIDRLVKLQEELK